MKTEINGVQIELTPEQIQQVLHSQKPVETREERFRELIEGIEINHPTVDFKSCPTSMFWSKDDNYYFEYDWKLNYFLVNRDLVWKVFEVEFNMKYDDIKSFMKIMAEQHFNLEGVTPLQWVITRG